MKFLKKLAGKCTRIKIGIFAAGQLAAFSPHASGQATIGSPGTYITARTFFVAVTNGVTTNSYSVPVGGAGNGFVAAILPGATLTITSPPVFAIYRGRGFSFMPQLITTNSAGSTAASTNQLTYNFNLVVSNRVSGIGLTSTTSPLAWVEHPWGTNVYATPLIDFYNFAGNSTNLDNATGAVLSSIFNNTSATVIISNASITMMP